jgi:hypothetical protein
VPCHRVIGTDGSPPVMQEVYGVKNGFGTWKSTNQQSLF